MFGPLKVIPCSTDVWDKYREGICMGHENGYWDLFCPRIPMVGNQWVLIRDLFCPSKTWILGVHSAPETPWLSSNGNWWPILSQNHNGRQAMGFRDLFCPKTFKGGHVNTMNKGFGIISFNSHFPPPFVSDSYERSEVVLTTHIIPSGAKDTNTWRTIQWPNIVWSPWE